MPGCARRGSLNRVHLPTGVVNLVSFGATVVCECAPDPKDVSDDASHPIMIRGADGNETIGLHNPAALPYREYNSHFRQRSGPAVGIFSQGKFRYTFVLLV
jgi:hypothetical protein